LPKPGEKGLARLISATGYSWAGLRAAFVHEAAFRQEAALTLVLVPLGIWLGESGLEKAVLVASWLLVLLVELLNSAIEAVVDRIGDEMHPLAGRAKDIGSAAVLLALLNAAIVWGLVLFL
jgi:diacylglycerol kinase (ATP)